MRRTDHPDALSFFFSFLFVYTPSWQFWVHAWHWPDSVLIGFIFVFGFFSTFCGFSFTFSFTLHVQHLRLFGVGGVWLNP